ncbi:uncharacterized protein A1O9_01291 [Exophiala aquamarina CBS 119918]|uniref:Endoplasmic reticulum lectin n=1 Tax=Exophiala aquamarina CBS 119918 TaxID=1182545 RepID=A0A072PTC2_9EURO|nr:uncharacterized protein A1O9_01291 [Exophiala aquamarina CBS 119918]KEF63314.1 hypothetical protein A1O9_01291 [Exophiala aquamarina CBS 119918]
MKSRHAISAALTAVLCLASEVVFNVNDDVFAYPQYDIEFLDPYVLQDDAEVLLNFKSAEANAPAASSDASQIQTPKPSSPFGGQETITPDTYERIIAHGRPYLCAIPVVKPTGHNETTAEPSTTDREKELEQAVSRGAELLQGMTSNQCLYYSTGWWTYSFCYNAQITQFHALPPGTNGRVWPPQEDPQTPSYVLGKFKAQKPADEPGKASGSNALSTEVQTKAETNYLVQRLGGGTACDLTGNDRKVEVQFHCNPQMTDRIGWIKETATCAYLMIIYTPRLCNDVAFQPPKESRAHSIICQEIISQAEVEAWEDRYDAAAAPQILEQTAPEKIYLGSTEVGGMKYVGSEGKKLERGRIVLTQDERAETVVMQKDGHISGLSKAELKKMKLDPDDVETFRKELQKMAGSKDWKIERLDDINGRTQLRGVVSANDDEDQKVVNKSPEDDEEEGDGGSREEYKGEL